MAYSAGSSIIPVSARGSSYGRYFHVTDWLPAFIAAAGDAGGVPSRLDGVDQWAAIRGLTDAVPRTEVLLHLSTYTYGWMGDWRNTDASALSDDDGDDGDDGGGLSSVGYTHAALRSGDWKLILYEANASWVPLIDDDASTSCQNDLEGNCSYLFNLTADPYERDDLTAAYPSVVSELKACVEKYRLKQYASCYESADIAASNT